MVQLLHEGGGVVVVVVARAVGWKIPCGSVVTKEGKMKGKEVILKAVSRTVHPRGNTEEKSGKLPCHQTPFW